jgi:hypothetical protein
LPLAVVAKILFATQMRDYICPTHEEPSSHPKLRS